MTNQPTRGQGSPPVLTLGLPTYNGERFLAEAIESLLAQTFTDFELIISDNASTDGTQEIAEKYAALDPRVRYLRHPVNKGATYNHNIVIEQARGTYFKWVSDDDLWAPTLLERCVAALQARPELASAHALTAYIDEDGNITQRVPYPLVTDVPRASDRFRSLLVTPGGDDIYGVIPIAVLRRMAPFGSYHLPDRTFTCELALNGPFWNDPEYLYFRRDHEERMDRVAPSPRLRSSRLDPRRADRLRHPMVRLYGEYLLGFVTAIWRAPISPVEKARCYRHFLVWLVTHVNPTHKVAMLLRSPDPATRALGANTFTGRVVSRAAAVTARWRRPTPAGAPAQGGDSAS